MVLLATGGCFDLAIAFEGTIGATGLPRSMFVGQYLFTLTYALSEVRRVNCWHRHSIMMGCIAMFISWKLGSNVVRILNGLVDAHSIITFIAKAHLLSASIRT